MQDINRQSLLTKDTNREPLKQIGYRPNMGSLSQLGTNLRAIAHSVPVKHPKVEIPTHESYNIGNVHNTHM